MGAAATPIGNMVIKLGLDDADFGKGVANSKKQIRYLAKEMSANMKIADMAGSQINKLGARYNGLTNIIGVQEQQVKDLRKAYDESFVKGKATDSTKRLAAQLQDANGKLANYKLQLVNTAGAMAEWKVRNEGVTGTINSMSGSLINAGNNIQTFGNGIQTVGRNIQGTGSLLTKSITAPILATTTAFAASLIKVGLDTRKFRAQAQIYYEGLYQDAGKAKQQLDDLMTFAKTTPFQYESIVQADQTMQTFGVSTERSKEILVALANTIAATGGSSTDLSGLATVMGQIESSGKLSLEDMNQLVTYKIPAFKIVANELGISVQDLRKSISKGEISSDQAINSLTKGLMQGTNGINGATQAYTGSLEKVKQTLPGAIDSMKSAWKNLALDLVDENGFDKVIKSINKVTSMLKSGAFNGVIKSAGNVLGDLVDDVGKLAEKFASLKPEQQQMIMKMIAFTAAAGPVLSITGKLTGTFGGLISILGKATTGTGNLGKKFVELTASMAKKSAITGTTEALTSGALATTKYGTAMAGSVGGVTELGAAAASAGGASGVGALTASLGALGPVALGVAGAGGLLAVGYGVWKLTESYRESSQRVKRWGSDVGEATDEALTKVQVNSKAATGEFSLMEQGISGNTGSIVSNFEKMGKSIESNLTKKIEAVKEIIESMPEDVRDEANELDKEEIKNLEKARERVKENNEKITQIKQEASNNNRQISYEETAIIKDLANESAESYVKTLGKSEKETKQILNAMTGNVESASKEQAKSWIRTLGEQRQKTTSEYSKMTEELKTKLTKAGYDLDSEYAKKHLDLLEKSSKAATAITEDQMALILAKYPEIAEEVWLANGQLIDSTNKASQFIIEQNKETIKSFTNMSNTAAKTAEENAKKIDLVAKSGSKFGQFWNDLVLDPKTGSVKTNAQEEVNKAAESEAGWNQLMWLGKSADISSNAKLMIAEAAIVNGKWDSMTFTEQQALIETNATKEITQALQVKGDWDNLSFEEKKAIIYSNSTEAVAETLANLGLWDEYSPQVKDLDAKNYDFLSVISQSEEKLNDWGNIPAKTKDILGDNYDFLTKVYESDEEFARWQAIPNDTKEMLAQNGDLLVKLFESKDGLNTYNDLSPELKTLLADGPAKMTYEETTKALQDYDNIGDPELKRLLGDNSDVSSKISSADTQLKLYELNHPETKFLKGDSSSVDNAAISGGNSLNEYSFNNPLLKYLRGDAGSVNAASTSGVNSIIGFNNRYVNDKNFNGNASSVVTATGTGINSIISFNQQGTNDKNLKAIDNASPDASIATNAILGFINSGPDFITKTLRVNTNIDKFEDGTNYHLGGPAIVNDQKGSTYKELILPKGGVPFIPEGRDVLLPNLKRGSKVIKASKTKQLMARAGIPKYESGIGVPENSTLVKSMRSITPQNDQSNIQVTIPDNGDKLDTLINIMSQFGQDLKNMKLIIDGTSFNKGNASYQSSESARRTKLSERGLAVDVKL